MAQSTLTVSGLTPFTTYYLRAGSINWNNVPNFVSLSTQTSAGVAPSPVSLTAVYITSATLTYGTVGGSQGYELDASSTNFAGGITLSSVTVSTSAASLTVQGLNPDTTYYFEVGSLFSGATSYSATQPSTSHIDESSLADRFGVSSSTATVNGRRLRLDRERIQRKVMNSMRRPAPTSHYSRHPSRRLWRKAR